MQWGNISGVLLWAALAATAQSAVITSWDFEDDPVSFTGQVFSGSQTAVGTGTFGGRHASTSTSWAIFNTDGGNTDFRANNWSEGDYFEFVTDTAGFENLSFSFNLLQVGLPPMTFSVLYGLPGTKLQPAKGSVIPDLTSFGDPTVIEIDNPFLQGKELTVLIVANGDAASALDSVRIDNVQMLGDAVAASVPEPSAILPSVLLAGAIWVRKRRKAS